MSRNQMLTKTNPILVLILCYGRSQNTCFKLKDFGQPNLLNCL
jgi:hypothetical protein